MRLPPAGLACLALLLGSACNEDVFIETPPVMQLGVESLEFGAVAVGRRASREVVVQNAGAGPLQLGQWEVSGTGAAAFTATLPEGDIVPAGQGRVVVTFAPPDIGRFPATLTITGNDPKRRQAAVELGGDGYRQGALQVEPDELDFGRVDAGSSATGTVLISNVGNGDLLVQAVYLSDDTSPDFRLLSSTQPGELPGGRSVAIRLAYSPGLGSLPPGPGQLVVEAADPLNPRVAVTLRAELNRAPVAEAGPDQQVDPLDTVVLDGTGSHDDDGDLPLAFSWTLTRRPEGSASELQGADSTQPVLVPDLVGLYEAELWVIDSTGLRSLLPDRVLVTAVPAERVLVELVWDSPIADLDLHLVAPGGSPGGALDCYYDNPRPDWGTAGDDSDDPQLKRDDYSGFGPEVIGYAAPGDGVYQLLVDYYASHTPSGREPTTATLRVFVDGVLAAEISRRLETQGSRWLVATLQWPEGIVVAQDVME